MPFRTLMISFGFIAGLASAAQAEVPLGLWQSAPDRSGLVVHVRTKPCGSAICGRVERAKDMRGYDTPSTAVGQKVLQDMALQADGSYIGQFWEPEHGRMMTARMQMRGNELWLQNCDGARCEDAVWRRLR